MKKILIAGLMLFAGLCWAQTVPNYINYQGRLIEGTNLYNGTVDIAFRLFNAAIGGVLHYEDSNTVTVVDGLYSTFIGDNTVWGQLDNALYQDEVWIEVVLGTNVMAPRERLASVGYARFAAKMPDNGVTMGMIAPDAVQYWHIATGQIRSNHFQAGSIGGEAIRWVATVRTAEVRW